MKIEFREAVNHSNLPLAVSAIIDFLNRDYQPQTGEAKPETIIVDNDALCEKLGISLPTLIRWRHKGKIPFLQIGSAIRYDLNAVLKALEAGKKKGV